MRDNNPITILRSLLKIDELPEPEKTRVNKTLEELYNYCEQPIKPSKQEQEILNHLVKAYNIFIKLKRQHPDELSDFVNGIHKCQYIIGMRVARKAAPKVFTIKGK